MNKKEKIRKAHIVFFCLSSLVVEGPFLGFSPYYIQIKLSALVLLSYSCFPFKNKIVIEGYNSFLHYPESVQDPILVFGKKI